MSPLLLLTIPLIAAAPVPKDFKKEASTLDGAWLLSGMAFDGRPAGSFTQNMTWTFNGDTLTFSYGKADGTLRTKPIKTDKSASPKQCDFDNGTYKLGVYEVNGDTLTIVMGANGARPADMTGGTGTLRYTFTRVATK